MFSFNLYGQADIQFQALETPRVTKNSELMHKYEKVPNQRSFKNR